MIQKVLTLIFVSQIIFSCLTILFVLLKKNNFGFFSAFFVFLTTLSVIVTLWIHFQKIPFETYFETKIWFVFFVSLFGLLFFKILKLNITLIISSLLSVVFIFINLLKMDTFNKVLPPALQSPWFIPHVAIYIIAYSLLAISMVMSVMVLLKKMIAKKEFFIVNKIGLSCLLIGLLIGSLWANDIWGNFWSWDIKESFALITCILYAIQMNFSIKEKKYHVLNIFAFAFLILTWLGMHLIKIEQSLHIYG